jgi:ribosomal protein S18 acetylase RimI-like enzyme
LVKSLNAPVSTTIRDFDPSRDRAAIRDCIGELQEFEHELEVGLPAGVSIADACLELMLRRCSPPAGHLLVAEIDGAIAGFVSVEMERILHPDEEQTPYAYVSDLVVLTEYRRRGVGRALLEQAKSCVRNAGVTVLRIGVFVKNQGAARLYRRFGFTDYRVQLVKRLS